MTQELTAQAKAETQEEVELQREPPIAPPVIDFELARISEEADSHLPESLNFDLQMPDMSKVSRCCHSSFLGIIVKFGKAMLACRK